MKKIIITILILFYFYITYISLFTFFYLSHFQLIHNVYIVSNGVEGFFPEWCPFGQHKRQMTKEMMTTIGTIPILISIVMTIIFNKVNKIIRWVLILLPIILILAIYLLTILNPLK
jgi:hypothetical protein